MSNKGVWKVLRRLVVDWLRGDHLGLQRDRRLLALHLLDGEADTLSFRREPWDWKVFVSLDGSSRSLTCHGSYERDEAAALIAFLKSQGRLSSQHKVVVDVGANIGAPTLHFTELLDQTILAIEPMPETFGLLRRNVSENSLDRRIVCIHAAVDPSRSQLELLWHRKRGHVEVATPTRQQGFGPVTVDNRAVQVPAARLDRLVREQGFEPGDVGFVWSDTEGYERQVIEAGTELWAAGVPFFTEVSRKLEVQGGYAAFADVVGRTFDSFIGRDELLANPKGVRPRPIRDVLPYLQSLRRHSNALFLPRP